MHSSYTSRSIAGTAARPALLEPYATNMVSAFHGSGVCRDIIRGHAQALQPFSSCAAAEDGAPGSIPDDLRSTGGHMQQLSHTLLTATPLEDRHHSSAIPLLQPLC